MSSKKQIVSELSSIVRNKAVITPIIAVMLVPLLYSSLFLGAFWDPYTKLDKVPVAIVNEDIGAELDGEFVEVGQQFVDKLKESSDFDYRFISKKEAMEGLTNNEYYIMIEIPAQFSENAVSLTSDEPKMAELIYMPNESYNFLASQIGGTAVKEMATALNKQLTETYLSTIYDKIDGALDGLGAASDGAFEIAKGTGKAADGAAKLEEGLSKLSSGAVALQTGTNKLNAAGSQLKGGLKELGAGGQGLHTGLEGLLAASQTLQGGMTELSTGYQAIDHGLLTLNDGTSQLKQGALKLQEGLSYLASVNSELGSNESFQALVQASKQLTEGLKAQEAGQATLLAGSTQYVQGLMKLQGGGAQFNEKLSSATTAAGQLAGGIGKVEQGASQLVDGIQQLDKSTGSLVAGSKELHSGSQDLRSGLITIQDGSQTLSTKLGNASGESLNVTLTDEMKEQFAQPVQLTTSAYAPVPNYGTGFTPYFLSLGLYVGAMLLTIVYSMRDTATIPKTATSWYVGKTTIVLIASVLQAIVASVALILILKLDIVHLPAYFLFTILTSVSFMMLIQFLCVAMGNAGRFIAIVLLILQLTSSAGTFPLELVPDWLQTVNPLLPMTYSVTGLKYAISSGNMELLWGAVWPMLMYTFGFSILTYLYMNIAFKKKRNTVAA